MKNQLKTYSKSVKYTSNMSLRRELLEVNVNRFERFCKSSIIAARVQG